MNLARLSLGALVVAMIVSCVSELNVGVLALALAWLVGVYAGHLGLNDVLGGFPAGRTGGHSAAHSRSFDREVHAHDRGRSLVLTGMPPRAEPRDMSNRTIPVFASAPAP